MTSSSGTISRAVTPGGNGFENHHLRVLPDVYRGFVPMLSVFLKGEFEGVNPPYSGTGVT